MRARGCHPPSKRAGYVISCLSPAQKFSYFAGLELGAHAENFGIFAGLPLHLKSIDMGKGCRTRSQNAMGLGYLALRGFWREGLFSALRLFGDGGSPGDVLVVVFFFGAERL